MPETDNFGLPYPIGADEPNGPVQLQALAEAVDDAIAIRSFGSAIIPAAQTTQSASFTQLGTPDRVQGLEVPAGGLLFVTYRAQAGFLSDALGEAQIFVNSAGQGAVASWSALGIIGSYDGGLRQTTGAGVPRSAFLIDDLEGTFEVSVRYRRVSGSGDVQVSSRALRAWVLG